MWDVFFEVLGLTFLIAPFVLYGKAVFTYYTQKYFQRPLDRRNILYVIAHPDDEAMFFAPSIVSLRATNNLHLLCLSTGNADGLGRTREKELQASAKWLGFQSATVIDDPEL